MTVDEIISIINNLPLKEALLYLSSQGITQFVLPNYEKIKRIIQDKQNEGKYAFVPNKQEALFLEQAESNPNYQQVKILVPNYKYIDLIRTGLLIREYNNLISKKIDIEKNRDNISRIKVEILKRLGGRRLLKIVKLPNSNFFPLILSYLYELKIHSYPENQLEEEFNELVDEWEKCTKFVDNSTLPDEVLKFCKQMIFENNPRFFVMALYPKNIKTVEDVIKELEETKLLKENNYLSKIEKEDSKEITPGIEIRFFKNPTII